MGDDCHSRRRQSEREHDEASHRSPIVASIPKRGVVRRIEQHGRDEQSEHQLGRKLTDGAPGRNASIARRPFFR